MASFTDPKGKVWEVDVNVASVQRVISLVGVNLSRMRESTKPDSETPLVTDLYSDDALVGEVLYAICKPQADASNLSKEDFSIPLKGEVLAKATAALWESCMSFFEGRRPEVIAAIKKQGAITAAMAALDMAKMAQTPLPSATSTQGSAASPPETTPSSNSP